ncbi:MAG TPA: hypothetical protein VGY56_02465 [Verrucomicrobiae bacterium]|nr:hypothetical protein [Verrucomicrobiae bacterium]
MKHRSLKIECTGDFFKGQNIPKIRLQGKWLAALGFVPNGRVTVQPTATGELLLKFLPPQLVTTHE